MAFSKQSIRQQHAWVGSLVGMVPLIIASLSSPAGAQDGCFYEPGVGMACPIGPPTPPNPQPGTQQGSPSTPSSPPITHLTALQNALPRYRALIESLSGYGFANSWQNFPLGTEGEFLARANDLHRILTTRTKDDLYSKNDALRLLQGSNAIIQSYPSLIANLRSELASTRSAQIAATAELDAQDAHRELTLRTANQLDTRASQFESATKRNQEAVLTAFSVLLPPRAARSVSPRPYESIFEPNIGVLPERERPRRMAAAVAVPFRPPLRAIASPSRFGMQILPLPLSVEQAVGQLERDGAAYRAGKADLWAVKNRVLAADSLATTLQRDHDLAKSELSKLWENGRFLMDRRDDAEWAGILAQDALHSAQATFVYRATEAWIWENAKPDLIDQVKAAVELTARKRRQIPYLEVSTEEIEAAGEAGKQNIFGLPDSILAAGGVYGRILKSYATLRTHSEDYMIEASRVLAHASPEEIEAFARGLGDTFDSDARELANENLDATGLPEPFRSLAVNYLLNNPYIFR